MKKRLKQLVANEVSLVKRGANKRPLLVLKNAQGSSMSDKTYAQRFALNDSQERAANAVIAKLAERVRKDDATGPLSDRAQAALKAVYRILLPFKDELTDSDLDALQASIGIADDGGDAEDDGIVQSADGDDNKDSDKDKDKDTDAADKADDNNQNPMSDASDSNPEDAADLPWGDVEKPDNVSDDDHKSAMALAAAAYRAKTSPDATEKRMQKSHAAGIESQDFAAITKRYDEANRALVAKSAELEARLRKMDDAAMLRGIEDEIRGQFKHLAMDVSKTARVLKTLKETAPEAHADYLANLKAVDEQMRVTKSFGQGGLYGAMGGHQGAGPTGNYATHQDGNAAAQLEAMVEQHVAKGECRTKASAWESILKTQAGQQLYTQMCVEQQGGR